MHQQLLLRSGPAPVACSRGARQQQRGLAPGPAVARCPTKQPVSSSSSRRSTAAQAQSGSSSSAGSSSSGNNNPAGLVRNAANVLAPTIFGSLEQLLARSFGGNRPGQRDDWQEVEGNWVLRPPAGVAAEAVVHFLGGAFVGAAPQLAYRLFLESLASRGVLVITTPVGTSFDQLRAADEAQYKFDRCCKALEAELSSLPVYGVGHSMGSLLHMLICARYAVKREGNVLMSFNNRPATDSIPFLSPFLAPSARAVGPLLEQLATSPFRAGIENVTDTLRGLSPSLVKQLLPIVDQLTPIYMDVAQGRQEFSPSPEETAQMLRNYYAIQRNLVLRFKDDTIDDSLQLTQLLQNSSAISSSLDLSLRTLDGSHIRPMEQALVDLPPEVARVANQAAATGGTLLGRLADMATQMGVSQATGPLGDLSKGVQDMASMIGGQVPGSAAESVQGLADEVAAWMGVGDVVVKGRRALPASSLRQQ